MMPSILTFVSYYLPGFKAGGPLRSIANLVEILGDKFQFRIVTADRDSGDAEPYRGVSAARWLRVGNADVMYLPARLRKLRPLAQLMSDTTHDVVYLNSFFSPRLTTLPLLAQRLKLAPRRPVVLAPRGEFSQGALRLSPNRKRAFILASRAVGLHRDIWWQASSEYEAADICSVVGRDARIHIASDLPRQPRNNVSHQVRAPGAPLRVLYLSRVTPMKNLLFVLEVLAKVTVPVELSIVGYVDTPTYWAECQDYCTKLPPNVQVRYEGAISAVDVPARLARSDLFFLPTLGENFGHVIIEALGAGTPALISDRTPWLNLEGAGCGWVVSLDKVDRFIAHIEQVFHEGATLAMRRREACIRYAHRFSQSKEILEANRALFQTAIARNLS